MLMEAASWVTGPSHKISPRSAELWMNTWLSGTPPCYEDVVPKPVAPPPLPEPEPVEQPEEVVPVEPVPDKKRRAENSRVASKRPRVPQELCVEHTEATYETLTNMSLPRSEKISTQENQHNVAEIARLEALLGDDLDRALKDRPPLPMKHRWKNLPPEQKELEGKLNRKATDHYNKLQYAWNRAEVARLKAFIND